MTSNPNHQSPARSPAPPEDDADARLDEALDESFPASDPPAIDPPNARAAPRGPTPKYAPAPT